MKRLLKYVLFFATESVRSARNGRALSFIAEEIKTKKFRFQNKSRIEEMRRLFDASAPSHYVYNASPIKLENVYIFSLCHSEAIPEQKLSILSFLRHAGCPAKWSVVSDGSINESEAASLRSIHPTIHVVDWRNFLCEENASCFEKLSRYTIFAKKFALMSNLPDLGSVVCMDSDILFFEGAGHFRELLSNLGQRSYYQEDLPGYLDPLYLTKTELEAPPLNAGFVVQGRKLDWSVPIARLNRTMSQLTPSQIRCDMAGLEQSASHLAHYLAGSLPLGEKYALQLSDRFDLADRFSGLKYVMRHYVRPVRFKMWLHSKDYLCKR